MATIADSPQPPSKSKKRRLFLLNTGKVIRTLAIGALLLPVIRFLDFRIPPRPRLVKVNKILKQGGFIIENDFIIFDTDSAPIAVSRKCTHLGCRLNYHEQEKLLICPCHQSRFTITGKRVAGPARINLKTFLISVTDDGNGSASFVVSVV